MPSKAELPRPNRPTDPALAADFTAADKDKDKDKSLSTFEARHLPMVSKAFAKHDLDGNQFPSFDEYMAAFKGPRSAT